MDEELEELLEWLSRSLCVSAAELRYNVQAILAGTVCPRTCRVATALGITNEGSAE